MAQNDAEGWVILNSDGWILDWSFAWTRTQAIKELVTGSAYTWKQWYHKGFRCKKSNSSNHYTMPINFNDYKTDIQVPIAQAGFGDLLVTPGLLEDGTHCLIISEGEKGCSVGKIVNTRKPGKANLPYGIEELPGPKMLITFANVESIDVYISQLKTVKHNMEKATQQRDSELREKAKKQIAHKEKVETAKRKKDNK